MTRCAWCAMALVLAVAVAALWVSPAVGAGHTDHKSRIDKSGDYDPLIDPADFEDSFGDPLPIDNPYFPLAPGTSYFYEGETEDGLEEVQMYVTYDTREILGVTCRVVAEAEWLDGALVEYTFDWFAQDVSGNVWYFGEYSEAYEPGEPPDTEGSWEAGVDGAQPGIIMLGAPVPGASYRQEYYEDEAEDMGKVLRVGETVSIDLATFYGCLRTKEWTPLEPGSVEHKHYAPGIGLILVVGLQGPTVEIELVGITTD